MKNEIFSPVKLDALREIISIGTAHSATALSKLIDKTITVNVPELNVVPLSKIPELLGGAELSIVGLYFRISGDLTGNILLFFPQPTVNSLIEMLTANITTGSIVELTEIEKSALMELGNILTNSYLNAMAETMDIKILLSVPYYASDMLGAVIDFLLIEIAQVSDYVLLMKTVIESTEIILNGNFIIFPDRASFEKIFDRIGLK